jgi:hypothetical protein
LSFIAIWASLSAHPVRCFDVFEKDFTSLPTVVESDLDFVLPFLSQPKRRVKSQRRKAAIFSKSS